VPAYAYSKAEASPLCSGPPFCLMLLPTMAISDSMSAGLCFDEVTAGMLRYFFDIVKSGGVEHDDLGIELPSIDAACAEAVSLLPCLLQEQRKVSAPCTLAVLLRDSSGKRRLQASISVEVSVLD
jgi:hypothetical protein